MIDNNKNIQIVVENLKKHSIRYIVISPGGTNIGFIKAVQDDPFFRCFSVVDERSAMYFAIGLYLQTGEIIATSCTSAQATRNYVPGLTEAYYKRVPILAITMSKHPRFTYQEYMQAPDQCSLPNDCVKKSFSLPMISTREDVFHSVRTTNEAILEVTHHGNGPVQLCIPWLDFALKGSEPANRSMYRYTYEQKWDIELTGKRVLIVIGEHIPFSEREKTAIEKFCENCNCAVYTNHLSNFRGKYSFAGNLLFSTISVDEFQNDFCPDILISIGGQTGDYPFYGLLSKADDTKIEHWRVACNGNVVDTYDKLTKVFECTEAYFFEKLSVANTVNHEYYNKISNRLIRTDDLSLPFSNAYAAQKLTKIIPRNSVIQFSILNSLRVWNLFRFSEEVHCFSNVGAFGIDGGMSTLIGQSMVTDELCFMVIGDLSFLYDINSLSIRGIKNNLRILLVNNNGGVEFKLGKVDRCDFDRFIAASGHFKSGKGWAETCGFKYLCACNCEEFEDNKKTFVSESDQPIIFELFVSDNDDATAYNCLIEKNTIKSISSSIKDGFKSSVRRAFRKNK